VDQFAVEIEDPRGILVDYSPHFGKYGQKRRWKGWVQLECTILFSSIFVHV
jgi:hypothetical protein